MKSIVTLLHDCSSYVYSYLMKMRYLSRWFILSLDMSLCAIAFILSSVVLSRFVPSLATYSSVGLLMYEMLVVLMVQISCFIAMRTYRNVLRFSTYRDLAKLLLSQLGTFVTLLLVNLSSKQIFGTDLFTGVSLFAYIVSSTFLLGSLRIGVRIMFDVSFQSRQRKPLLILGTREVNISAWRMLKGDGKSTYRLRGFAEDNMGSSEKLIMGVPVVSIQDQEVVHRFIQKHGITHVLITSSEYVSLESSRVFATLSDWGLTLLQMPEVNLFQTPDADKVPMKLRPIHIEDLLNRKPIEMDSTHVSDSVTDRVVMVTGAAGSIGSELVRQLVRFKPSHLLLIDNAETPLHAIRVELESIAQGVPFTAMVLDVRNSQRLEQVMAQYHPKVVYHAAAYKHVPMMEDYPSEAIMTNVLGTKNVADACRKCGVERMVMVSTDKAVNPSNVMGCSKRIAEIYVQSLSSAIQEGLIHSECKYITTRFGNVLGSNGSVIPFFKKQIEQGGPVTVTHPEITRFFMTIPEACQLVLQAGTMGQGGEIYIFDMGKSVKILDLAMRMIRLAGYVPEKDIEIVFTGLRPGEKLYEELLNTKESTKPTYHEKIHIADVQRYEFLKVNDSIASLISKATSFDDNEVVQLMKAIVPEYVSMNSVYQKYDHEAKKSTQSQVTMSA